MQLWLFGAPTTQYRPPLCTALPILSAILPNVQTTWRQTSISRDRLAVSSYDNFFGAKMGILNEKKTLFKDLEQFSILKTFITYIKLTKNEIKNFVSYTL